MASRAVIIFVVLHMGTRKWLCTFKSTRPDVTSLREAEEPLTRGGGVDDGVSVGSVGTGVGMLVGRVVGTGVGVGVATEAAVPCPDEKSDEKRVTITTTSTHIRRKTPIRRVRSFMLLFPFLSKSNWMGQTKGIPIVPLSREAGSIPCLQLLEICYGQVR
jgi:hypothetical protein